MQPPEPVLAQGVAFVVAALTGVALGLGTDGYRAALRAWRPPRALAQALDVAFVASAVPVVAAGLLAADWGAVRVYPLLALLGGFGLYLGLGSPVCLPPITRLARALVTLARGAWRVGTWPCRRAVVGTWALARALGVWVGRRRHGGPPTPPPIPGGR